MQNFNSSRLFSAANKCHGNKSGSTKQESGWFGNAWNGVEADVKSVYPEVVATKPKVGEEDFHGQGVANTGSNACERATLIHPRCGRTGNRRTASQIGVERGASQNRCAFRHLEGEAGCTVDEQASKIAAECSTKG